jgi:hypothetical protein
MQWWAPTAVLAECEARRQLIDRCTYYVDNHRTDDCSRSGWRRTC